MSHPDDIQHGRLRRLPMRPADVRTWGESCELLRRGYLPLDYPGSSCHHLSPSTAADPSVYCQAFGAELSVWRADSEHDGSLAQAQRCLGCLEGDRYTR